MSGPDFFIVNIQVAYNQNTFVTSSLKDKKTIPISWMIKRAKGKWKGGRQKEESGDDTHENTRKDSDVRSEEDKVAIRKRLEYYKFRENIHFFHKYNQKINKNYSPNYFSQR